MSLSVDAVFQRWCTAHAATADEAGDDNGRRSEGAPAPLLRRSDYARWRSRLLGPSTTCAAASKFGFAVRYSDSHWKGKRGGQHSPEHVEVVWRGDEPPPGFNFTRVQAGEVLARLDETDDVLLFNVSPMFLCHSLYVPWVSERRPQVLTAAALWRALRFLAGVAGSNGDCRPRMVYNSLGAFASVNHLHLHYLLLEPRLPACPSSPPAVLPAETLEAVTDEQAVGLLRGSPFPIELSERRLLSAGAADGHVWTLCDYPARALCVGVSVEAAGEAAMLARWDAMLGTLHGTGTAYNLLLTPSVVYVVPRRNQSCNTGPFRIAVVEAMGCPVAATEEQFAEGNLEEYVRCMEEEVSLPQEDFDRLVTELFPADG